MPSKEWGWAAKDSLEARILSLCAEDVRTMAKALYLLADDVRTGKLSEQIIDRIDLGGEHADRVDLAFKNLP